MTAQPIGLNPIPEPDHPTKTTKIANYLTIVALFVVAVAVGIFLRWSFQSPRVLVAKNEPFPTRIIQDPQTGNSILFLTFNVCKEQEAEGSLRTSFLSSTREVFLPVSQERSDVGCREAELPVVIPTGLEPDKYKVKFRVTYDLNPIKQNVVEEFESQEFTIK